MIISPFESLSDTRLLQIIAGALCKTNPDGTIELIPFTSGGGGTWGTITGTISDQTDLQAALDAKENLSNKATNLATSNDTLYPTVKAVNDGLAAIIASSDAMVFKGVIDASGNPNYPAADRGHTYRISVAGKIGGASGINVEAGDLILCLTDGTASGNQATVGTNWTIAQTNLDGAVIGPISAIDGRYAQFDGTSGTLIKVGAFTGDFSSLTGSVAAAQMPALTGEVTSTAGTVATTVGNAAVIGKVLTGFTSGAGVVAATDTILQAFQKLNGNVAAIATPPFVDTNALVKGSSNPAKLLRFEVDGFPVGTRVVTFGGTFTTGGFFTTAAGTLVNIMGDFETSGGFSTNGNFSTTSTVAINGSFETNGGFITGDTFRTASGCTVDINGDYFSINNTFSTNGSFFTGANFQVIGSLNILGSFEIASAAFQQIGTGAFIQRISAATDVTFPTTGILATLAGAEALSNKTINGLTPTALSVGFSIAGGTTSKTLTVPLDATVSGTHSGTSSGTNTGDQSLTGDVTASGTGAMAATIAAGVVTFAKLATAAWSNDTTLAGDSAVKLVTEHAVKAYADQLIASADAIVFKGVIDASANPNYPAADAGHTYRISVAGKIGGASGVNVEVGDLILCLVDGTASGNQATVGANWSIAQTNIDGAVVGPTSANDGNLAFFDGASGKLIKDGGNLNTLGDARWQAKDADLTSWAAITRASGFDTFATTPSSASFAALITDETGTGGVVLGTSPTIVTPTFTGLVTEILVPGANTVGNGVSLLNNTAATSGNQQFSPALHWKGFGWSTDSSASESVEFRAYIETVEGAPSTDAVGLWTLRSSLNGAPTFTLPLTYSSLGDLEAANNITAGFGLYGQLIQGNTVVAGAVKAAQSTTITLVNTSRNKYFITGTNTNQTIKLPVASGLENGHEFFFRNLMSGTGTIVVQSSGANTVLTIAPGASAFVTCTDPAGGTGTASWSFTYFAGIFTTGKKLTVTQSLTFAGTDGTTQTFPTTSATIARTDNSNTFTGDQTFGAKIIGGAQIRLKGYTVATLPAATQGDTAFCTDLLAPGFLVAAVGGGAVVGPVFYNGAAWVAY